MGWSSQSIAITHTRNAPTDQAETSSYDLGADFRHCREPGNILADLSVKDRVGKTFNFHQRPHTWGACLKITNLMNHVAQGHGDRRPSSEDLAQLRLNFQDDWSEIS